MKKRKLFAVLIACVCVSGCLLCACSGTQSAGKTAGKEISVTVLIDASEADRGIFASDTLALPEKATVYDALSSCNVVFAEDGSNITSINGLAAGEMGSTSGWLFYVNGEMPMDYCKDCILSDGDEVTWRYIKEFTGM